MDFRELKKIIDLVKDREIAEFNLEDGDLKLSLKMQAEGSVMYMPATPAPAAPGIAPAAAAPAPAAVPAASEAPASGGETIDSPMVGTFYRASSPDADPFVKVGDVVTPETTVCIIEAMKVMNEIKAETKGKITKILIENGEAVEFGQGLFEIEAL